MTAQPLSASTNALRLKSLRPLTTIPLLLPVVIADNRFAINIIVIECAPSAVVLLLSLLLTPIVQRLFNRCQTLSFSLSDLL